MLLNQQSNNNNQQPTNKKHYAEIIKRKKSFERNNFYGDINIILFRVLNVSFRLYGLKNVLVFELESFFSVNFVGFNHIVNHKTAIKQIKILPFCVNGRVVAVFSKRTLYFNRFISFTVKFGNA